MNKIMLSRNTYRCRLCLKVSTEVINIFREDFAKMIKLLTNIQVERTDDLPKVACIFCTKKVKEAMILRKQIIRSHRTLQEEALAKTTRSSMSNLTHTKTISNNCTYTCLGSNKSESKIEEDRSVVPQIIIFDAKNDLEIKQVEPTPEQKINLIYTNEQINQLNKKNDQNFTAFLNESEISIVKIIKPNHELAKITRTSALLNNTRSVQLRQSFKRQPLNFALNKSNIQLPKRTCPKNVLPQRRCPKLKPAHSPLSPVPCKVCQKSVLQANMKKHLETHDVRMVTCHLCGKITKSTTLRAHIFYFHKCKEDEYVCDQCGRHFRYRYRFNVHMKKSHGGTKDFECTTCGRRFFERKFLTTHINSHHKKIRPFICHYCGKDFSTKHSLRVHLRQHTESTPYSCNTCGLKFKQKVSLKTHCKQAHDILEEETVFCEVCGKGFASTMALANHFRLHERKKCMHCSDVFVRDDYLERHIKDKHGTEFNSKNKNADEIEAV